MNDVGQNPIGNVLWRGHFVDMTTAADVHVNPGQIAGEADSWQNLDVTERSTTSLLGRAKLTAEMLTS